MDAVIMLLPPPAVIGEEIAINLSVVARWTDGAHTPAVLGPLTFSVIYAWTATLTQKKSAILAAAKAALEGAYGITVPAGARAEIFGL